jgi:hypothetical protein
MGTNVANQNTLPDLNYIQSSLIPAQSLTYSIGSSNFRWKDMFLGPGTINITDAVTGNNAAISVANGVFFIDGIAQAQLPNVTVTNLTFSDNTVQTTAAKFYNGSFEDTTTQISAGTTSANRISFNTTTNSQGISLDIPTSSRVTFANAGTYQLALTAQFCFSGGASSYNVTLWYAKNGNNVTNSARTFVLTSGQGAQVMATLIDDVTVTAGQYIQFYWWTDVAPSAGPNGIYLYPTAAGSNPTRPAAPSVTLNVFNVGA